MRGLLLGGLVLALGIFVTTAHAQETVQWRPAGAAAAERFHKRTSFAPKSQPIIRAQNSGGEFATVPGTITVLRPRPIQPKPSSIHVDPNVRTVSFQPYKGPSQPHVVHVGPEVQITPVPIEQTTGEPPVNGADALPAPRQTIETAPMPKVVGKGQFVPVPSRKLQPVPNQAMEVITEDGATVLVDPNGMIINEGEAFYGGPIYGEGVEECCPTDSGLFHGCGHWHHSWNDGCCENMNCRIPRFYANAEFLLWGMRDPNLPPIVTTTGSSLSQLASLSTVGIAPGSLYDPGVQVLYGGDEVNEPTFTGGRFTLGFGKVYHNAAIEATFMFLGEARSDFAARSEGNPILSLPFLNVNPDGTPQSENVTLVAFPGAIRGDVISYYATRLWGMELNVRKPWYCGCNYKLDGLLGFRYLELTDEFYLQRTDQLLRPIGNLPAGFASRNIDVFGTRNRFFGGQVGFDFEYYKGRWVLGAAGKLALGGVHQQVRIEGYLIEDLNNNPNRSVPGEFYAQSSNIGRYERERFAVVPEMQFKVGYKLSDNITAYAAYNFLYISNVARAGDQIDRSFNVGGASHGGIGPIFVFQDTSHWAQGVSFGVKCEY